MNKSVQKGNAVAIGPWRVDGNLVYRLNQYDTNHEEIRVQRTGGSPHDTVAMHNQAVQLQRMLNVRDGYQATTIDQQSNEHDEWGVLISNALDRALDN